MKRELVEAARKTAISGGSLPLRQKLVTAISKAAQRN
jgi:hypothetical protein